MHKTFSGHQHKSFLVSCFVWGEQSSIITSTLINITITSMLFLFLPNIQVSKDIWNIGTMEKSDFQNSYLCLSIIILQLCLSSSCPRMFFTQKLYNLCYQGPRPSLSDFLTVGLFLMVSLCLLNHLLFRSPRIIFSDHGPTFYFGRNHALIELILPVFLSPLYFGDSFDLFGILDAVLPTFKKGQSIIVFPRNTSNE